MRHFLDLAPRLGPTLTCFALFASVASAQDVPTFSRDVRPILADKCFACHGPDAESRRADLRFDVREVALEALSPKEPSKSALLARIHSADPDDRMPPPESGLALTAEEKDTLRRWIENGATYEEHWAFAPLPKRVEIPGVDAATDRLPAIDRFVRARLARQGIEPAGEAERWRWLRRVTFDLTGLPPTEAELREFLADDSDGAHERVVDRLLANPRYGEHMAVAWLDVARYADSYGYQSDRLSPTWHYRDWVVRAFNRNLSYDRFVTEQVAGDMLEDASREQVLATAFNRLHRMTNEGGSIAAEYRVEYAADRVRTFGTAFLGLTLECARCHDHKFDPITQREYYGLMAYFNSIDEYGLYHDSSRVPTPSLLLPNEAQEAKLRELEEKAEAARRAYVAERRASTDEERVQEWLANAKPDAKIPDLVGHYALDGGKHAKLVNSVDAKKPGRTSPQNRFVESPRGRALRLTGDDVASFPGVLGALRPHEPFSISLWLRMTEPRQTCVVLHRTGGTDVGYHGTELMLQNGRVRFAMVRHWPGNAIAVESRTVLPRNQWAHLTITWDASYRAEGLRIYANGRDVTRVTRDNLTKNPGVGGSGFDVGQRFREFGFKNGEVDEIRAYARALSPIEVAHVFDGVSLDLALRKNDTRALAPFYVSVHAPRVRELQRRAITATRALFDYRSRIAEVMVMRDTSDPEPTHVLARGAYDAPKTEANRVDRHTPECLPRTDAKPTNRLGLARWLTEPNHPLLARVTVNRFWARFFGAGLVGSVDNFGIQGAVPTHPRLLDWLARDFVEHGWDVKRLCKEIVLSRTYRQSSALRPGLDDGENRLLARGPARRLSAEQIRDLALAASGLLDEKVGGPPVSPYQPKGLWRENNTMTPAYRQSVGTSLYRRSLYSVWKRTTPLPNMLTFDATTREVCRVQRRETNTPLQALVLLNDTQFVEAARALGDRMLEVEGDTRERIHFAFVRLVGRDPTERETELLTNLYDDQRELFAAQPKRAAQLTSIGASKRRSKDVGDLAAATVVAQTILNLDATVWRR